MSYEVLSENTVFRTSSIRVYHNGSGEVFVELIRNPNVCLRISDDYDSLTVTCHNGNLRPWAINGLEAFRATAPKPKKKV